MWGVKPTALAMAGKAVQKEGGKAATFKQMDFERYVCGVLQKGKQVVRPARFFVSEP